MALNTKAINRRIKSVTSTRKITKAMELVSASKMRKAVAATLGTRPYAVMAWKLVDELPKRSDEASHPLLTPRAEVKKRLAVLFTSDRGLCGGFNAQVLKTAAAFLARGGVPVEFATVGKRGEAWLRRRGLPIVASFPELAGASSVSAVRPLAKLAADGFVSGRYDETVILYTDYVSAIAQRPRAKTLIPLRKDAELGHVGAIEPKGPKIDAERERVFEPDPRSVLDALLPRIVEVQLWQALLESQASEHSARMLAMRNATESATEMIDDLRFTFNQARQAGITREIAEIAAGAAALEK